jgi:hypothetical protein
MIRLDNEYDGAGLLHTHVPALRSILPHMPEAARVMAWVKGFAAFKRNVSSRTRGAGRSCIRAASAWQAACDAGLGGVPDAAARVSSAPSRIRSAIGPSRWLARGLRASRLVSGAAQSRRRPAKWRGLFLLPAESLADEPNTAALHPLERCQECGKFRGHDHECEAA